MPQRAHELGAAAGPLGEEPGRRRRHHEVRRGPVPVVELLPSGRGEEHLEVERTARDVRRRPPGAVRRALDGERRLGQRDAHQPVRRPTRRRAGRARDRRRARRRRRSARRGPWPGSDTCARRRVEAADRAVVGVGDRRPSRPGSSPTPSGCCSSASAAGPSIVPEVEEPACRPRSSRLRCAPDAARTSRSRRATASPRRRIRASPDVCANHACGSSPSTSPSFVVPANDVDPSRRGSSRSRRWTPAMAIDERAVEPRDVPRAGQRDLELRRRDDGSPCIHCTPVPAIVRVVQVAVSTPRSAWLTVSATTTS